MKFFSNLFIFRSSTKLQKTSNPKSELKLPKNSFQSLNTKQFFFSSSFKTLIFLQPQNSSIMTIHTRDIKCNKCRGRGHIRELCPNKIDLALEGDETKEEEKERLKRMEQEQQKRREKRESVKRERLEREEKEKIKKQEELRKLEQEKQALVRRIERKRKLLATPPLFALEYHMGSFNLNPLQDFVYDFLQEIIDNNGATNAVTIDELCKGFALLFLGVL